MKKRNDGSEKSTSGKRNKILGILLVCSAIIAVVAFSAGTMMENNHSTKDNLPSSASTASTSDYEFSTEAYMTGLDADDYVTLKDYKGFTVEVAHVLPVTDEDVEEEACSELSVEGTLEEVTDHDDVQNGDWVNIDYTGTVDGKEFDGGSAAGQNLKIGSGGFNDGFDGGLIGHKKGDEVTLNLKFPDDYGEEDLNGKDVLFKVKINLIEKMTYPELTDETVADAGYTDDDGDEIKTVDAFKTYIRKKLEDERQEDYDSAIEQAVGNYLLANNEIDPPASLVNRYEEEYKEMLKEQADYQGVTFDDLMKGYGYNSSEEYTQAIHKMAEGSAATTLILNAIADKEGLTFSDEDYEKARDESLSEYGDTGTTWMSEMADSLDEDESYRESLFETYIMDWVTSTVKVEEPEASSTAIPDANSSQNPYVLKPLPAIATQDVEETDSE